MGGVSENPRTRYARNGDIHIAYQTVGDGDLDLLSWAHREPLKAREVSVEPFVANAARGERYGIRPGIRGHMTPRWETNWLSQLQVSGEGGRLSWRRRLTAYEATEDGRLSERKLP
jgi:hypothetical protein